MNSEPNLNGTDPQLPLIYMWEIHDGVRLVGRYIGKCKNGSKRPNYEYKNNVRKLRAGLPYRKGNPAGYRRIHRAMAAALDKGFRLSLTYLCNVPDGENIDTWEERYIQLHGSRGHEEHCLNGPRSNNRIHA